MNIIPPGTPVKLKLDKHNDYMVTAACIRFGGVNYELTYILNGEPKTIWAFEQEFETDVERKKIGFK